MRRLRRLAGDRRGAALAELALVMPFMLVLLIGFAELLQLVETHRRISRVASSIGDLAAQEDSLTDAQLADIFRVGPLLMAPMPATGLGERLTLYTADGSGRIARAWSKDGPTAYVGSAGGLPADYKLIPGGSVVVADVSYTYSPMAKWILPDDIPLQKRMYLRPRNTDAIGRK